MKRRKLQTIVLASSKGGSGKSTMASALAVRAAHVGHADSARVALLDTDPQLSLARWHELRGFPDNPKILDVDASSEAMALVQGQRWDYLIIDTPPALLDRVQAAIFLADIVVVPIRPSPLDVEAVRDVVTICQEAGKPIAFLINQMPAQGFERLAIGARRYLDEFGPVFATEVGFRKAYVSAMTTGRTGPEMKDKSAAKEIDDVWVELLKFLELARVSHG